MNTTKCYSLLALWMFWLPAAKAQRPIELTWQEELEYRAGKHYKEEKYYKNGKLDSTYRKWDIHGRKVTEGYYIAGKRHGKWLEWLTIYQLKDYLKHTYSKGILKKTCKYRSWGNIRDSIKWVEHCYTMEPDDKNFTVHKIYWDVHHKGKKRRRNKDCKEWGCHY